MQITQTIKFKVQIDDIELTAFITIATLGEVTLNLNGHKIGRYGTVIYVNNIDAVVNICGDGEVESTDDNPVTVAYGTVNIYEGKYTTLKKDTDKQREAVLLQEGAVNIYAGEFYSECTNTHTINCIDKNYNDGTAKMTIMGGTFIKYNPENNAAEWQGTNFVADGYKVVSEPQSNGDIWYTVIEE